MKERLELVLYDWGRIVCVMSPFVLLLAETNPVPEEGRGKKNSGSPLSSSGNKVVLTLLTKVVAVHVGLIAVYVWGIGLQILAGCLGDNESESRSGSENGIRSEKGSRSGDSSLQNSLKNLPQVILRVLRDTSSSSRGVNNRGFYPRGSDELVGQFVTQLGR